MKNGEREFIIVTYIVGGEARYFVAQGGGDQYTVVGDMDGYQWPLEAEEARKDEEALARVQDRDLLKRLPAHLLRRALDAQGAGGALAEVVRTHTDVAARYAESLEGGGGTGG